MKKAIVTLAIGEQYINIFNESCKSTWDAYGEKHNIDLIIITNHLDETSRAKSRSPAWQKCLVFSQPEVEKYDQVAWVDSDIVINPSSPDIFNNVPIEKIGAVDDYAFPSKAIKRSSLEREYEFYDRKKKPYINNLTATAYHTNFGLHGEFESVVQTGVMVASPKRHKELYEHVYYNYEEKGEKHWNLEMRPLSYEILNNNIEHWIDPRFNMMWPRVKQDYYPFLDSFSCNQTSYKTKKMIEWGLIPDFENLLRTKCVTTAYLNSFFLHFGGGSREMSHINHKVTSVYDV